MNVSSCAGRKDDRPLAVEQASPIPGVPVGAGTATLAFSSEVPSEVESAAGKRSTLLINQP